MNYVEKNSTIKSYFNGSRRPSNIFWACSVSLGGFGFFLTGLSSFFKTQTLSFLNTKGILFIPQGIILLFYGTIGTLLGIFLLLTIYWNVGAGYNEYNKVSQKVVLYRQGFPGTNREFSFTFPFAEIKAIKMRVQEGLNPKRQLILCLIDNREIPLTGIEQPISLNVMEEEAITLAKYLNVSLETE